MQLPNLAGVATADLVEQIGTGSFKASYINWSRTLNLLRTHAPGWLPETVPNADGGILHAAPVGCYMMIRFRHGETLTPPVPQAVMDHRNNAIPHDKITARDITDTHRRGICLAAAMTFGLAYELWAKMPLESGHDSEEPKQTSGKAGVVSQVLETSPALSEDVRFVLNELAQELAHIAAHQDMTSVVARINAADMDDMEKIFLWSLLPSSLRSGIKAEQEKQRKASKVTA